MKSKKIIKRLVVTGLATAMCFGSAIATFAASGSWKNDSNGWWYSYTNGGYPKKQWLEIDKTWYYFKEDGYMSASEYREGYWIDGSGACSTRRTTADIFCEIVNGKGNAGTDSVYNYAYRASVRFAKERYSEYSAKSIHCPENFLKVCINAGNDLSMHVTSSITICESEPKEATARAIAMRWSP